jgi:Spy/CpxP family protein refolding chaperone
MNRLMSRTGAAIGVVAALAMASPAAAQGPGPGPGRAQRPGPRSGVRGGIVGFLAEHPQSLNLNDQQAARLRTIAAWMERSDSTLRGQMRAAMAGKNMRQLSAEERYQLSKQMRPLRAQMQASRYAVQDSLHAVLTPDQWQQLSQRGTAARAWGRGYRSGFARGRFGMRGGPWGRPRGGPWGGPRGGFRGGPMGGPPGGGPPPWWLQPA